MVTKVTSCFPAPPSHLDLLPQSPVLEASHCLTAAEKQPHDPPQRGNTAGIPGKRAVEKPIRSEERRVGKEC